jgi:hypothetical protein
VIEQWGHENAPELMEEEEKKLKAKKNSRKASVLEKKTESGPKDSAHLKKKFRSAL